MNIWKGLAGRVSLLTNVPTLSLGASILGLYQQAWGSSPQNFQEAPNPLMPSTAQGIVGGMLASCNAFPNRVDFNFGPNTNAPPDLTGTPTLRLIEDARALRLELFRIAEGIGLGSINMPSAVNRVAIFVQFAAIEPNLLEANKAAVHTIPEPYRMRLSDEEAFVFQVSRPKPSQKTEKVKLNFVSKWSVEQFQVVSFGLSVGGFPGGAQQPGLLQPQVASYLAASVSFDCNTTPTREELTRTEQSATLFEALQLTEQAQHEYGLNVEGFAGDRTH